MSKERKRVYRFGPFCLDSSERTLMRDQEPVPLTLKAFDILVVLVQNSGCVLHKEKLMNAVWADTAVEESNLSQNIYMLRKALGQISEGREFIETVPRVGYRFAAPVEELHLENPNLVLERHSSSEIVIEQEQAIEEQGSEVPPESKQLAGTQPRPHKWLLVLVVIATISVAGTTTVLVRSYVGSHEVVSVVVLPFVNATGDPEQEYLSDEIAEDVIDDLARLPNLRVMSRHTAFSFKGRQNEPQQVGKILNVTAVLTGRMTRENGALVLKTELVNVSSGNEMWGNRYRSGPAEIFGLHDDLARDLAARFHWGQAPGERKHTPNDEAYQLYLRGKFYYSTPPEDRKKALMYLRQAVEKDPEFADAYAFLAWGIILFDCVGEECRTAERDAERYAERALQLDPNQGRPHTVLAILRTYRLEWPEAEREFKRGIELSAASEGVGHGPYARFYLIPQHRYDEAIREFRKVLETDPYAPVGNANMGWALFCAGKNDEAMQVLQRALQANPENQDLYQRLGDLYAHEGHYDDAAAAIGREDKTFHFPFGHLDTATFWNTVLRESSGKPVIGAYAGVALGKKDDALTRLETEFAQDQGRLAQYIRSPLLDGIRSEPRYAALMKKMDLPL